MEPLFDLFQFGQSVVFAHRELRPDIRSAHAASGIILRIAYTVGVVPLDVTAQRTNLFGQPFCNLRIEERSVEIRPDLSDNETRPDVGKPFPCKPRFQLFDERVECAFIGQTAVHLLGAYLVRDLRKPVVPAEGLGVFDQFDRPPCNDMNVDRLAGRNVDIDGRIDMDQVVSRQQGRLERPLYPIHCGIGRPAFRALSVLEPGASVIDCDDAGALIMDCVGLHANEFHEFVGGHTRITAVAVHLIECCCEIDRGVVAFRGAQGGANDGR